MDETQSPINILTMNGANGGGTQPLSQFNVLQEKTRNTTTSYQTQQPLINPAITQEERDSKDEELRQAGFFVPEMSQDEKQKYADSLTRNEYERLIQYGNAGYSFGASKALLELEKRQGIAPGGVRGKAFQVNEPVGGANSVWNRTNLIGRVSEIMDDAIQQYVVPNMQRGTNLKESARRELQKRLNNLTDEEKNAYIDQYNKLNDVEKAWYGSPEDYIINKNTTMRESLIGADKDEDRGHNVLAMTLNAPASLLSNVSAISRGITNPLDTLNMLKNLLLTEEGRQIISERYLNPKGFLQAVEEDPIGVGSDVADAVSLASAPVKRGLKGTAWAERLAGATERANRTAKRADNVGRLQEIAGGYSDLGLDELYHAGLNKGLEKLGEGGKVSNVIGDYISFTQRPLRTIRGGANPNANENGYQGTNGPYVFPGIQKKVLSRTDKVINRARTATTGLTPEIEERIKQNPYVREYWTPIEKMMAEDGAPMDNQKITEGATQEIGEELIRRIEAYETKLDDAGPGYEALRSMTRQYNILNIMPEIYEIFNKHGIALTPDGELSFRTTANPSDMNPIKTAWSIIRNMEPQFQNMTPAQILDFRKQLRSLINYDADTRATRYSKAVLREIVDKALNGIIHKEIPGLEALDKEYSSTIDELKKFKDGLIYQVGEKKGQIKDNFFSILKTLNTQNRQKMKARLEELFPGIGERIEAVNMLPKLAKAYQSSPEMIRKIFRTMGFMGGIKYEGGAVKSAMSWILGIVLDEILAKPLGEKRRKVAVDKLIAETSPEAQQKLADIASKAKAGAELSESEKQTLALAIQEIAFAESEYTNEQALKRFQQTMESAYNDQPKLPGGYDTIGPDGTIKLTPGKKVNNPETLELKRKDITPERENIDLQERLQVDQETAQGIQSTIDDFLREIGADENGSVQGRKVDYNKFSIRSLERLLEDSNIPQTEKVKIQEILMRKGAEAEVRDASALDHEYAYRIQQLGEEEQRIGKIGRNKVSKDVADKQMRTWETKREKIIEQIMEDYNLDQAGAEDKYIELEGKPRDYINEYKRGSDYRAEQAEAEVLERLKEGWKQQPKFVRDMEEWQIQSRQEFLDGMNLNEGYKIETTDYNDRYVLEDNGRIVDKGAIKYLSDGTVEITAQSLQGLKDSGILTNAPAKTVIKISGSEDVRTARDFQGGMAKETWIVNPKHGTLEKVNYQSDLIDMPNRGTYAKFTGKLTTQQKADGIKLYKTAGENITNKNEKEVRSARQKFLILNQKPGYAEALGLNPGEVNETIKNRGGERYSEDVKNLINEIQEGELPENRFMGIQNTQRKGRPEKNVDAVEFLTKEVKAVDDNPENYNAELGDIVDGILLGDSHLVYDLLKIRLSHQQDVTSEFNKALREGKASGIYYGDIDMLIAGQGRNTIWHEMGHYNDSYFAREIMGNRKIDFYASDAQLKFFEEGWKDEYKELFGYKSEEAFKFHGEIVKLVQDLLKNSVSEKQRKNKEKIEGKTMSQYYQEPTEVRGRFWESSMALIRAMNNYGKVDRANYKNNAGDVYTREQFIKLAKILQKHQKLVKEGAFHTPETPNKSGISWKNEGLYDIQEYDYSAIKRLADDMTKYTLDDIQDIIFEKVEPKAETDEEPNIGEVMVDWMDYIGRNYVDNVEQRTDIANEGLAKILDEHGFWIPGNKNIVPAQKMHTLNSNLREIFAYRFPLDAGERPATLPSIDSRDYVNLNLRDEVPNMVLRAYNNQSGGNDSAPTADPKVNQLVALSNMSVDKFKAQMEELGGKSPMPSIAVTDVNVPHTDFGDLTLVFGRDTIDPKANPDNKILGSDAYTPTFPDTDVRGGLDTWDKVEKVESKVKDLLDELPEKLNAQEKDQVWWKLRDELKSAGTVRDPDLYADKMGWFDNPEKSAKEAIEQGIYQAERAIRYDRNMDLDDENFKLDFSNIQDRLVQEFANIIKENRPEKYLPGYLFKGQVRWNNRKALEEASEKLARKLPEKGKQKLIDDGYEEGAKSVFGNGRSEFEQAIMSEFTDMMEQIEDRPNYSVDSAGRMMLDKFVDEYGYDVETVLPILESIYGDFHVGGEGIDPVSFAEELYGQLPDQETTKLDRPSWEDLTDNLMIYLEETGKELNRHAEISEREKTQIKDRIQEEYLRAIRKYVDEGGTNPFDEMEMDTEAIMENVINAVDRDQIIENTTWKALRKLVNRDRPFTPENVLEAMRNQRINRTNPRGDFKNLIKVEGKEITDIEDIREKNLQHTRHYIMDSDLRDLERKYDQVVNKIVDEIDDPMMEIPRDVERNIVKSDIEEAYSNNLEEFKNNLEELESAVDWEIVPDEELEEIQRLVETGKQVPVKFSEAKPDRLVDLEKEVEYILVPYENEKEVNEVVKGTPLEGKVYGYNKKGYKSERSDIIKELQKKYGNIFFSMGGVVMPIAMLAMMMQEEGEE